MHAADTLLPKLCDISSHFGRDHCALPICLKPGAAAQVSDLKDRQARVWDTIKAMDEPPLALVTSSMERLTQLIEKAEPILQTALPAAGLPAQPSELILPMAPKSEHDEYHGLTQNG